jgi:hypothetical protein
MSQSQSGRRHWLFLTADFRRWVLQSLAAKIPQTDLESQVRSCFERGGSGQDQRNLILRLQLAHGLPALTESCLPALKLALDTGGLRSKTEAAVGVAYFLSGQPQGIVKAKLAPLVAHFGGDAVRFGLEQSDVVMGLPKFELEVASAANAGRFGVDLWLRRDATLGPWLAMTKTLIADQHYSAGRLCELTRRALNTFEGSAR